ncbi:protein kinase domain-containing protein [Legionella hackeliae]|uniref:Serine/threonine-protein kinase n=1 Tax=Legionella hackeliae TaxID=449 RepID=A0A0A8URT0_LEGHA|nr:protein kinase [Legionella hackeliae]KTD14900.1 serine/threonine-protein kinase [Legionella hackeliae]CEK09474.1 Serine/threonine-protein kinase [Legionella hackeliae]STX49380.1 serine/threonine-protein kinase [Legionella hackeliae]
MAQYINLLNLTASNRSLVHQLLTATPNKTTFAMGSHWIDDEEIIFSHRIIRHLDSTSSKNVYEVLGNNIYGKGCFGELYLSLLTISIDESELITKIKPEDKQRLVKVQPFKYVSKENAEKEVSNLRALSLFHCKPLTVDEEQSYIVMRKLPGLPLMELIEANQLTIQQRFDLTIILVQALQEQIHSQGFIHRDINPKNILVDKQFIAYFIDLAFAIIKGFDDSKEHHGAIPYAAPECYSFYQNSTIETDIYALGRVLMLLWGDDVFANPDFHPTDVIWAAKCPSFATLYSRMNEIPTCHAEIKALLRNMMHEDSFERPTYSQILDTLATLANKLDPIPNPSKKQILASIVTPMHEKKEDVSCSYDSYYAADNEDDNAYNKYLGFGTCN